MKVYGYHLRKTDKIHSQYWPPNTEAKLVEDATTVEVLKCPWDDNRVFLYIVWPDKFKYLLQWPKDSLEKNLPEKFKKALREKKMKTWSRQLEKNLLKDARPHK